MRPGIDLRPHGIYNPGRVVANASPAVLIEEAIVRGEATLSDRGALVAETGSRTGRSPRDRFVVSEAGTQAQIWWGSVNRPIEEPAFDRLLTRVQAYLQGRDLFVCDAWACADPRHRLRVRIIGELAWHTLFARCLLLRPSAADMPDFKPDLTIFAAPLFQAYPASDGTRNEAFILIRLTRCVVVVAG